MSKTLLIVDDDNINRLVLRLSTEKNGYQTIEAVNGQDAIDKIRSHPELTIILLDINMPILDGYSVIDMLNNMPEFLHRDFKIVVISANLKDIFWQNINENAIDPKNIVAYFEKPVDMDNLLSTISQI